MVPGLCCPSSWPTKSHPRLSSSCLLKGGAGGSSSLAGEATGMVVASEVLPLSSEAPGWRLCCAELARHRSGWPMVVLRSALARHWARRLKGQCLAVQCWAMLMQSPAACRGDPRWLHWRGWVLQGVQEPRPCGLIQL